MLERIKKFQNKFGYFYKGKPRFLSGELRLLKETQLLEELSEYITAKTLEDKLDALVDMVYVTIGISYFHGFDFDEAFNRVHEANMNKIKGKTSRGFKFDIKKPKDWKPADLSDLVNKKGES